MRLLIRLLIICYLVISALHFYQILDDVGPSDLVIGKEDGAVEIYAVDESDALAFRYSYVGNYVFYDRLADV